MRPCTISESGVLEVMEMALNAHRNACPYCILGSHKPCRVRHQMTQAMGKMESALQDEYEDIKDEERMRVPA